MVLGITSPCQGVCRVEVKHEEAREGVGELPGPEVREGAKLAEGEDGQLQQDQGRCGKLREGCAGPGGVQEEAAEAKEAKKPTEASGGQAHRITCPLS